MMGGRLLRILGFAAGEPDLVVRLTKAAGRADYDIGGTAIETFAKLVSRVKTVDVGPLLERAAEAHRLLLSGLSDDYTAATMRAIMSEWDELKVTLRSGGSGLPKKEVDEVIQAVDQHLGARYAFALDTVSEVPPRPTRLLPPTVKQTELPGPKLAQDARTAAVKGASADEGWKKLFEYVDQDDPAWEDLAALIVERSGGKQLSAEAIAQLVNDVQGKLGEHLAMRLRTVSMLLEDAYERAASIVKAHAAAGWQVRFCDGVVRASTVKGGIQQSYDASIWLIREAPLPRLAMPVQLIQVKSGTVREAMEQIGSDVDRAIVGLGRTEGRRQRQGGHIHVHSTVRGAGATSAARRASAAVREVHHHQPTGGNSRRLRAPSTHAA
jgi:hypothetical protein